MGALARSSSRELTCLPGEDVNELTAHHAAVAVVPMLPALYSLVVMLGWGAAFVAMLLGISGSSEQQRMIRRFLWKQRYSLLVIFGIVGLGWHGVRQLIAAWTAPTPEPLPIIAGQDWPMFRGGPDRTGVVAGSNILSQGRRLWSAGFRERFYATPAVVGNRVFSIGSRDDSASIFCWDADTGKLQWVSQPGSLRTTFSSPVVVGNLLVCGEGLHTTTDARVFCLDLCRPGTPQLKWSFPTRGHVEGTPVIVDDRVYVTAGDDGVYALSLHEMRNGQPTVVWHVPGNRLPDVETALLADREYVYVGLGKSGNAVVMLEAATGREAARFPFDYPVFSPPALDGHCLYVGMGTGDFVRPSSQGGGAVACIDVQHRTVRWEFPTPGTILGAIIVSNKEVLFGCADGRVRVLSTDGELQHSWDSGAPITASLAVTTDAVCGVNARGRLFVLRRPDLRLQWESSLGNQGYFLSSPTISRGRIFVGSEQFGFQCIGTGAEPAHD